MPKSIISAYLSFFPVTIGMVKGLTSPEVMQLDLMRTYTMRRAARFFFKLRLPAAVPFLFASLKVAIAIALTGAIVGELPTGAQAGWAQAADRQLLRPDGADLGSAVRRCHQRRAAGLHDCCDREADRTTDGSAVMMAGPGAVLLLGLAAAAALIGMLLLAQSAPGGADGLFWIGFFAAWALAWGFNARLAALSLVDAGARKLRDFAVPAVFGAKILLLWEIICIGGGVPMVLMPAPSLIIAKFMSELPTLWADFVQTVIRAVIPGWAIGSALGVLVAILCDRVDFRGADCCRWAISSPRFPSSASRRSW